MPPKKNLPNLLIEDAQVLFRNFTGEKKQYNDEGDRNFCVLLEPSIVDGLVSDGWNVKYLKPREPEDDPRPYMQVSVSFKNRPPRLVLLSSRGRQDLTEETAAIMDWVDISKVDLTINPYSWDVNGNQGVKAYLKSIFITIAEDELELKYSDVAYAEIDVAPPMMELEAGQDPNILDVEVVSDTDDEPRF